MKKHVQPVILNKEDGGGIYNANTMEFIATAMEISSIGGRNVGMLIQQYLSTNKIKNKQEMGRENTATTKGTQNLPVLKFPPYCQCHSLQILHVRFIIVIEK